MSKRFTGHWDVLGEGPPVLCISGFASANWMFRRLVEPLLGRLQFILPDNRGMGHSPPATQPYGLDDLAADAMDLMDDLGHERFAVIGISMGGFIAQLLALSQPSRIERMVMLCTSSSGEAFKPLFTVLSRDQVAAIYQMKAAERIQAALAPQFCPLLHDHYPEAHAHVFQERMNHQEDQQQVLMQYDAVAQFLKYPLPLSAITCPTLILSGDQDLIVPPVNGQLLASHIPGAVLELVSDTDHLFFLEKPDVVAGLIGGFLICK